MPKMPPETGVEDEDLDTEYEPEGAPERGAARLYFYELPHYHENRRFDPRARGELAGVLPYSDDFEQRFARIAAPGWYAVEERRGGKVRDSWALEIRPDERRVEPPAAKAPAAGATVEEVAAIVARVMEGQKSEFQRELSALREELRSSGKQGGAASLRETLDTIKELREVAPELLGLSKSNGSEPRRNPEEELTLAIANRADLLGNVIDRISSAVALTKGSGETEETWADRALRVFERTPALQRRALKTWDAVNYRIFPKTGGDDGDGDEDGDEDDAEAVVDNTLLWVINKCAANEPVSFEDEEVKRFIEVAPGPWEEFVESVAAASVKQIIGHLSSMSPVYAAVLKQKHAPAWVQQYLKVPAVALMKERAEESE